MQTFSQLKKRLLEDPEFKKAYDALEPEFVIIRNKIKAKLKRAKLAKKTNLPRKV